MNKKTKNQFIQQAQKIHGDAYNYSQVEYEWCHKKVEILCGEHGSFFQTPVAHISLQQGCPRCYGNKRGNTKSFIEKSKSIHGNKFNYSNTKYVSNDHKIEIICKKHGSFFQLPRNHTVGKSGCPSCAGTRKHTTETFIKKAQTIHGTLYDYGKVRYINAKTHVVIGCVIHGDWKCTPTSHTSMKSGCPSCKRSKGERRIEAFLKRKKIPFVSQYSPKALRGIRSKKSYLRFDFFVPNKNLLIEFDGIQHSKLQTQFHKTYSAFLDLKARDNMKTEFAVNTGIRLLRIPHTKLDEIEQILGQHLD